jgi:hypothetical protein
MWEDNIKTDLKVTIYDGVEWIHLAQDTEQWHVLENMVMKLRVTLNAIIS